MEILNPQQRAKIDNSDDSIFYSEPRFVYHLDANFRKTLTELYDLEISSNSTVLDLMSSWDSYLPSQKNYKKVIGHGLNQEELKKNKSLNSFWVQNFNIDQKLTLGNQSIDYCLMVAAWQYLQYPELLTKEISRILNFNGKLIISFSNRAFWTKAPYVWANSNEEERICYVSKVLKSNGFNKIRIIKKFTKERNSLITFFNRDPFYCVIATVN